MEIFITLQMTNVELIFKCFSILVYDLPSLFRPLVAQFFEDTRDCLLRRVRKMWIDLDEADDICQFWCLTIR